MANLKEIVRKSKVNEISIKYEKEHFQFNLNEELSINPDKITKELQEQPSYYGFLLLLRNRLLTVKEDKLRQLEKIESQLYMKYCSKINGKTNRPYSDKNAKEMVYANDKYNDAKISHIKAIQNYNDINACVMAFEQRATLIQSISANLRNEK